MVSISQFVENFRRYVNIIQSFSFYGYSTPLSFKHLDTTAINDIESFVREELMELIKHKFEGSNLVLTAETKRDFFGIYEDHTKFQFSQYDLELIRKIIQHVRNMCKQDGFEYISRKGDTCTIRPDEWYFQTDPTETTHQNNFSEEFPTQTHRVLHKLLQTADKNARRPKGGFRFDEDTKSYAAYLRCLSGPIAYETLQKNLPHALPSLTTTNRFIARTHYNIVEGELRCDELRTYLTERNLPLSVSLSEDQTRIINRVQYDSSTNQLLGFVPPLNKNGLPIPFSFKARSAEEINHHFSKGTPIASFVNTIIAKPTGKAPSFCLMIFGSDSKYTSTDVIERWSFIVAELKKLNIEVVSFSSDSDPKYNAAMRKLSQVGIPSTTLLNVEWFSCGNNLSPPFYIQDTPHIATKLRTWTLKTKGARNAKKFPFGNFFIDIAHVQRLLDEKSKGLHRLTKTVLNPIDRQNYDSAKRLFHPRVMNLLKEIVPRSDATVKFLEFAGNVIDAFENELLLPLQRVEKMWYSLFMIRLWRQYIIQTKSLTLKHNFLTSNCYSCLELNAHGLILIMLNLKNTNQSELFKPGNYSSQPCEAFYRQIRSMSTVYSTVTNCSVKEILGRVKKIQLQNNISASNREFIFPRNLGSNKLSEWNTFDLPTEAEIIETVEKCKVLAIKDALKIGLIKKQASGIPCGLPSNKTDTNTVLKKFASMAIHNEDSLNEFQLEDLHEDLYAKNLAEKINKKKITETSPYLEIANSKKPLIVQKTYLCWLLGKESTKLSSDRLQRVQNSYARSTMPKKITIKQRIILTRKYTSVRKQSKHPTKY